MKHEAMIKRVLATMHEWWMDDADKAEFDALMLAQYGAQVEAGIEAGITNGYTAEQQEQIVMKLLPHLLGQKP